MTIGSKKKTPHTNRTIGVIGNRDFAPVIYGAFAAIPVMGGLLELSLLDANHTLAHEVLEVLTPILMVFSCLLAAGLFSALRRSDKRLQGLRRERDKANDLAARLEAQKAGLEAHAIVSASDPKGRITYANDKFCATTQYSRAELLGQTYEMLSAGQHPKDLFREIFRNIKQRKTWSGDICNRAKDGSLYWLATTIVPVCDAEGNLIEIVSLCYDITGIKQITEDLRQARDEQKKTFDHLRTSINSMRNGFAIWSEEGNLVLANQGFKDIYSAIDDDIVEGQNYETLLRRGISQNLWDLHGIDPEDWVNNQLRHRKEAGLHEHEHEQVLASGKQLIVSEIRAENGDIISTYIDVTAHYQREEELVQTRDALRTIAYFDTLTTLPNRARCQKDLEQQIAKSKKQAEAASAQKGHAAADGFSVVQIDLDNFKRVNDTLGHAAGDHLLKTLGSRLNFLGSQIPSFRPYRWGGDEFIAIVEANHKLKLEDICQELTDLIAIPVEYESVTIWPTVSLGIASYPEDAHDLESLMIYSDLALYRTKEMGRDGYQFFTNDMKEKVDADSRIEAEIRRSIAEDRFELYFQPQISSSDESITGIEALLRWNHPGRGLLPPGEFMEVVDSYGLAATVGRVVFDKAMFAARQWTDMGLDFGRLSINLSPQHVKRNTLLEDFFSYTEKHGVKPEVLAVEFLESFLMDDPNTDMTHILEAMAARGVHVELDDFGTGYASLAHLSSMPVDGIKIDRSFVEDIADNERQRAIVEVVMSMSKLMKLRVVCEGIETFQQLDAVSTIDNCSIQGYLVSRPLSYSAVTDWMVEKRNINLFKRPKLVSPAKGGMRMLSGSAIYE